MYYKFKNKTGPFEDFNVHHKDWLTYSGETDKPGELIIYNIIFYLKRPSSDSDG